MWWGGGVFERYHVTNVVPGMKVGEPSRRKRGAACRELEEGLPLLAVQSHQHVHKPNQPHKSIKQVLGVEVNAQGKPKPTT
jgi:hypothetical protein